MTEPIYALDLDEDLLSHLPDPDAWLVLKAEGVTNELIEDDFVAEVFAWQKQHLRDHGQPATASVLCDQFDLDLVAPETVIGDLIDRLRERYAKNQQRETLKAIVTLQKEEPLAVPRELIRRGRELKELLTPRGEVFGTGSIDRARNRYDKKVMAGRGASIGFPEIDDYFYGVRGVTLWIAPPKTMKSWIMCQGVLQNILDGKLADIYSLELPAEETDMRIRCLAANVPWWRYIRNCLTTQDWEAIQEADEYLSGQGTYRVIKPEQGHRGIDEIVYNSRDRGSDVIFIDQLQYVENDKGLSIGSLNNTGDYWQVLNRARDLSDDGPIVFAHQFNRSVMFADSMPRVEQAKGSSSIEEVATLALGMWANKDMRRSGVSQIGTLIARNQEYATWEMGFELSHGCNFEIIRRVEDEDE